MEETVHHHHDCHDKASKSTANTALAFGISGLVVSLLNGGLGVLLNGGLGCGGFNGAAANLAQSVALRLKRVPFGSWRTVAVRPNPPVIDDARRSTVITRDDLDTL